MKRLSLRPYPGRVLLFHDLKALQREHRRHTRRDILVPHNATGVTRWITRAGYAPIYFVYCRKSNLSTLVHELSHVVLHLFEVIGIDPRAADGEPFAYLLGQLIEDARH